MYRSRRSLKAEIRKQESALARWLVPLLQTSGGTGTIDRRRLEWDLEHFLSWNLQGVWRTRRLFIDGVTDLHIDTEDGRVLHLRGQVWIGTPECTGLRPFEGTITVGNSYRRFRDYRFSVIDFDVAPITRTQSNFRLQRSRRSGA